MYRKYYTIQELQTKKVIELPNFLYNQIMHDLKNVLGVLTEEIVEIFSNTIIVDIDQYVNIYKYIEII